MKMWVMCPTMSVWTVTIPHIMFFRKIKSLSAATSLCVNVATRCFQIFGNYSSHPPLLHYFHWVWVQPFSTGDARPWDKSAPSLSILCQDTRDSVQTWQTVHVPQWVSQQKRNKRKTIKETTLTWAGESREKRGHIFIRWRQAGSALKILVLLVKQALITFSQPYFCFNFSWSLYTR